MEFDIKSFKYNFVEKPIILMICFAVFNFLFWGNRLEGYLWWGIAVLITLSPVFMCSLNMMLHLKKRNRLCFRHHRCWGVA